MYRLVTSRILSNPAVKDLKTTCNISSNLLKHNTTRPTIQKNFGISACSKELQNNVLLESTSYKFLPGSTITCYRNFHLSPRKNIHPVLWVVLRPMMKVGAILSGRAYRKWWKDLPKDKRTHFREAFRKSGGKILVALSVLTGLATVNYFLHLQEAPITGRKRFIAFTKSQFSKIAEFEALVQSEKYKSQYLPHDHAAVKAVTRVAQRLYDSNRDVDTLKNVQFSVAVIDDDRNINAFVLPNGDIFVFTGLLKMMGNENQLAVVLGHEMAHAALSHGAEQVSIAQMWDLVVIVVLAALWAFLPNDGLAFVAQWFYNKVVQLLLEMPYNRKLEREADEVGLTLAAKACYDVREAPVFWTQMDVKMKLQDADKVEWMSTHPSSDSRAEMLDTLIPKALHTMIDCNCPSLPENDPRDVIKQLRKLLQDHHQRGAAEPGTNTLPILVPFPGSRGALVPDIAQKTTETKRESEKRKTESKKKKLEEDNDVPQEVKLEEDVSKHDVKKEENIS